jgi:hypothetical protein
MAAPDVLIIQRPFSIVKGSVLRAHTHKHTKYGNLINLKEYNGVKLIILYLNFSNSLIYLNAKVSDDIKSGPLNLGES